MAAGGAVVLGVALWLLAALPAPPSGPPAGGAIRIVSSNLFAGRAHGSDAAAATEADVLVLLEWTGREEDASSLRSAGYEAVVDHPQDGVRGLSVWLRGGRGTAEVLPPPVDRGPPWCQLPGAAVRLESAGQPLLLYAVHAPPPLEPCDDSTPLAVAAYVERVQEGRLTEPVGPGRAGDLFVLVGDLNSLPFQASIRGLPRSGLRDAVSKASLRPSPTWPVKAGWFAAGRIDYVFAPKELEITAGGSFVVSGSDHRAVYADLVVPKR